MSSFASFCVKDLAPSKSLIKHAPLERFATILEVNKFLMAPFSTKGVKGHFTIYHISHKHFSFFHKASDHGSVPNLRSDTTVSIRLLDVNDNAPRFQQDRYTLKIPEDTKPRESVCVYSWLKESLFLVYEVNGRVMFLWIYRCNDSYM